MYFKFNCRLRRWNCFFLSKWVCLCNESNRWHNCFDWVKFMFKRLLNIVELVLEMLGNFYLSISNWKLLRLKKNSHCKSFFIGRWDGTKFYKVNIKISTFISFWSVTEIKNDGNFLLCFEGESFFINQKLLFQITHWDVQFSSLIFFLYIFFNIINQI